MARLDVHRDGAARPAVAGIASIATVSAITTTLAAIPQVTAFTVISVAAISSAAASIEDRDAARRRGYEIGYHVVIARPEIDERGRVRSGFDSNCTERSAVQ